MAAIGGLALCGETSEAAQRFRATPLVKLNFVPDPDLHGTMGINSAGEVVYGYRPDGNPLPPMRAWVWLPSSAHGLSAGFHDLGTISGMLSPSIARDINDDGIVVGQSGGVEMDGTDTNSEITVWTLASTPSEQHNYGYLNSGTIVTDPWAGATAINNDSPPLVVGISSIQRFCLCTTSDNATRYAGFKMRQNGSPVELQTTGQRNVDIAYDVNTYTTPHMVGQVDCFYPQNGACAHREPLDAFCNTPLDPAFWTDTSTSPTLMPRLESNDHAEAHGINDYNEAVGWAKTGTNCLYHAAFWSNSSTVTDLHDGLLDNTHESRAEAINNLTSRQVVGWDTIDNLALLWEYDGSAWSVTHLNTASAIGPYYGQYTLRQAHGINDDGWIVCWGQLTFPEPHDDLNGSWAILLTPFEGTDDCLADVVVDNVVNVPDLLAVISGWGECVGRICGRADTNSDGIVDVTDLLEVINSWGSCGGFNGGAPETVEDCQSLCAQQYPGGGADYSACVGSCVEALCKEGKLPAEDCP